jgi:hypothetical protein
LLPTDRFKEIIRQQLQSALGREVSVDQARVTLLTGPGVSLRRLLIQEDPQFGQAPFAKLEAFQVKISLLPLLAGKIKIASLVLNRPEVRLIKNKAGRWNYESLAFLSTPKLVPPAAGTSPGSSSGTGITVSSLNLKEAVLDLEDNSASSPRRWRQEGISLRLRDFSPSQGGEVEVRIDFSGKEGVLKLATRMGPISEKGILSSLVQGVMSCDAISLAALQPILGYLGKTGGIGQGRLNARLEWKGDSPSGGLDLSGQGKISQWTHGKGDRAHLDAGFEGNLLVREDTLHFRPLKFQLPQSAVSLNGTIRSQAQGSLYDLGLEIPKAQFEDLLRLISFSGSGAPEGIAATGSLEGQLKISGSSTNPAVNGKLSFSPASIQYPGLQERIQVNNVGLQFEGSRFRSSLWEMTLGSRTRLNGTLTGSLGPRGNLTVEVHTPSPAQVAELLAIGNSFGVALPEGYQLQKGLASTQLSLQQSFQRGSTMQVHGKLTLSGCEARTPFLKVPVVIASAEMSFSGDSVEILKLSSRIEQTRLSGNLRLKNFSTPRVDFQLNADQLNLGQLEQWLAAENRNPIRPAGMINGPLGTPVLWAGPSAPEPSRDYLSLLRVEEGRLTAGQVKYKTFTLTQAVARLKMARKVLEMENLTFNMYGGRHAGSATLDLNSQPPRFSFRSSLSEVNLERFMAENTSLQNLLTGKLSLNVQISGSGSVYEEITRTLTGEGKLQLVNGSIRSFNLMEQLTALGRVQGLSSEKGETQIKDLVSNFTIANGRVQTSDLMAHMAQTTLRADGSFGFDRTLDYQLSAELPPSLSQGQNWAAQLANLSSATFFKGEKGQVVVPLRLRGNLDKPSCALDSQAIQANLKNQFLGGGMKQGMQGLRDLFKRGKTEPQTPASAAPPPPAADGTAPANVPPPPAKKKSSWESLLGGAMDQLQKKKEDTSKEKK